MIFYVLYLVSFLLLWYENKTIVLPTSDKPLIFYKCVFFQSLLWVTRLVCQYGSIAGLWYVYNPFIAIIGYVIIYAFGKFTFKMYFNREVMKTASYLADLIRREEVKAKHNKINEEEIYQQAQKEAVDIVIQNMKT